MRAMDSLTQAVFGATIQGAMLGRQQGRKSLIYGAILGTLPDLDVVMSYADPISSMTHHRGFSHSVFVLSLFALLLAWMVTRWRPSSSYGGWRLALTFWLVLITHTLLDALTSYGTQLLWPLMPTPASWSTIFIIDPVFTIPLVLAVLAGLTFGITSRIHRGLCVALAWCAIYLAWTFGAKLLIEHRSARVLQSRGRQIEEIFSGAAPLNSLLWRVIARDGTGHYYEGFVSVLDRDPPSFVRLPLQAEWGERLQAAPELQRLRWFTADWLRYDLIGDALVATDLRMGMAGHHFFRFVVARRNAEGAWHIVQPTAFPGQRMSATELRQLWQRIWRQHPALPLKAWDARMQLQE